MSLWRSVKGYVRIRILTADPSYTLTLLNNRNLLLESVVMPDPMTIEATVNRSDYKKIKSMIESHGEKLQLIRRLGFYWTGKNLVKRPVLLLGLLILVALSLYLPGRVFFVQVTGNSSIPSKLILEQAASCGIGFGALRRDVRSEQIKNALLETLPQLQWAGVNTSGCTATITVKEKSQSDSTATDIDGVCSIVAARDGIILECTVTKGNPLCKVGQAVKAGQTLVSGYTDCGLSISATKAEAEVYALTKRSIQACTPVIWQQRGEFQYKEVKKSLQIGKNIINFFNNSGISDTTCVKIYDKQVLTLPGGFTLPVFWITETCYYYSTEEQEASEQSLYPWLSKFCEEYLDQQMIAGEILETEASEGFTEGLYVYEADYACYEMIGQVKKEEIIQ